MMRNIFLVVAAALMLPTITGAHDKDSQAPPVLASLFGGPFELTDHNGLTRTDKDFLGAFMLIGFGYADCPSVCPNNLQNMALALDELDDRAELIQPVFVSIDPARDSPEIMKDFVANFHPRLIGLTGTEAQIRAAAKAYRVHRRKVVVEGEDAADYLVDHSSLTLLIGPGGKFATMFPNDTPPEKMAAVLAKYLEIES
jgi:protein SCO1/2